MNAGDLASIILTLLSSAVIIVGGIRWYIDGRIKPVHDKIEEIWIAIEDVLKETKTNGGSSMRDEIRFIKRDSEEQKESQLKMTEKLDHMYDILLDYISNSK